MITLSKYARIIGLFSLFRETAPKIKGGAKRTASPQLFFITDIIIIYSLFRPEQAVAGVAETRNDVAFFVQSFV